MLDHATDTRLATEELASRHLAGGLANHGYQCGMVWGAALFAGLQAYRRYGPVPQAESSAITASRQVVASFSNLTKNRINCHDITGLDLTGNIKLSRQSLRFLINGGPVYCARLLVKYSRTVYDGMHAVPPEITNTSHSPPVSCAALLAQKVGASDMQTVMAAGFAGGIGLSGGGCGALGAAIWIIGMRSPREQANKKVGNAKINEIINRFLQHTGSKCECYDIVKRKFEDNADHTAYLHDGGCAEIIDLLADKVQRQ